MILVIVTSFRHLLGWVVSAVRSREDLLLENLALRQQLLARHAKRPRRRQTTRHKLFWVVLRVLRTPVRAPRANAYCERLMGTIRRECLDFLIPLSESHLRVTLKEWVRHYNEGRPHMSLGPGLPADHHSNKDRALPRLGTMNRHRLPKRCEIRIKPVLGGLHHEYSLEKKAA